MASTTSRTLGFLAAALGLLAWNGCAAPGRGDALAPRSLSDVEGARVVWTRDTGRGIETPPLAAGESLYVTTTDRRVMELDPATGDRRWRRRLGGSPAGPPTLQDGTLYMATVSPDGSIYRFDLGRKKVRWSHPLGEITGSAVFFEGAVLVTTRDGRVFGLSPTEGNPIWVSNLGTPVWGNPELEPARALFFVPGRNGELFAVDARSGEKRWSADLGGPLAGVAARPGRVAAISTDGRVDLLDAATGNRLWKTKLDLRTESGPVWAGRRLVVTGLDGTVAALDTADGSRAWKRDLGGPFGAPAGVSDGGLAVGAMSGLVWRLDPDTGAILGRVRHPEGVSVAPVAAGGAWIVAGDRGRITAYRFEADPAGPGAAAAEATP